MDEEFIKAWFANKHVVEEKFSAAHPDSYYQVVHTVVEMLANASDEYNGPDPERIHVIDDGEYQGTLVFVIASKGYQPYRYWYVKVSYGSCSGCDTLEGIRGYNNGSPSPEQVEGYMTLALHVVQWMREMQG